jgi:pyruvate/2-oxoglutarate dehydrogenase complex dihydrolipoamide dehydrogenase (E3) component
MADAMARLVIRNALFFGTATGILFNAIFDLVVTSLTIPWCTFTSPELAHVGPYVTDLQKKGIKYDIYKVDFKVRTLAAG